MPSKLTHCSPHAIQHCRGSSSESLVAMPNEPERYLSWTDVKPLFGGISRTTAWRGVRAGWLPAPVPVSPGRRAWRASDVSAWQSRLRPRVLPPMIVPQANEDEKPNAN